MLRDLSFVIRCSSSLFTRYRCLLTAERLEEAGLFEFGFGLELDLISLYFALNGLAKFLFVTRFSKIKL